MLYALKGRLKRLKNDEKGAIEPIAFVVGLIILLYMMGFLLDVMYIGRQIEAVSSANTQLARVASVQGGVLNSPPRGWPGGGKNYITAGEMRNEINDVLGAVGITRADIKVNGSRLGAGNRIDYRETLTTEIEITYEWRFMKAMLPGVRAFRSNNTFNSARAGVSEWKYDYTNWQGE